MFRQATPRTFLTLFLLLLGSLPVSAMGSQEYFPALTAIKPDPAGSLPSQDSDWYKDQNFYHIWVAAFNDSDGDGIGDLKGITAKLDYLKEFGATALWLSPFCTNSSTKDNLHGYDTVDFYTVDPRFGTNDDLRELIKAAHAKGLRLIFDFVPNHVSVKNPWFVASSKGDPTKRDWFLWKSEVPTAGWKNWGGDTAWRNGGKDAQGKDQYYYALFWDQMPDLNYNNPEVRQAMANVAIYWLNQGFDGIRVDAVRFLFEDPATGDNGVKKVVPATLDFFQQFRKTVLDPYTKAGYPKFMVAENWVGERDSLKDFIIKDGKPGFQMTLDFTFGFLDYKVARQGASSWGTKSGLEAYWTDFIAPLYREGGATGTFLTNHDNYQARPATAFPGDQGRINLAVALQYTGQSTPFWFYGNELDMQADETGVDTNFRKPMEWARQDASQNTANGTYQTAQALMKLRTARVSLRRGDFAPVTTSQKDIKAYVRFTATEKTLVVMNVGKAEAAGDLDLKAGAGKPKVLLGNDQGWKIAGTVLSFEKLAPQEYRIFALE